ncbi:unnamed protein product [Rotaria magnacalcarata]|uniref:Bardet-Biedl syndrome 1 n=7 Tax=Rotaria magnacalcarata TaxID=392030 RepID=A0A814ZYY6_9BILA|nr:unnamed protein product [Rotaria magnacalcarata]CAF1490956.1 unnamed protein product [Rotaria magnacalcarata]CAF2092900.1 unnamed protein product [Rotaria magnacalcarata]CAF2107549.1 unnamed protein product [Rotaria magnacalcarata]CAF3769309.1 unnamed protein product [Rotaria magnacalcarata]
MSLTKGDKSASKYNQEPENNDDTEINQTRPTTAASDPKSKWLPAHSDYVAGINTVETCIELVDLYAEGSVNLVIADFGNILLVPKLQAKLKVFKGFSLLKENNLSDLPCAVVACYTDNLQPRIPALAVASGPAVFLFKSLRPYYKFVLPQLEIAQIEKDVWLKAREGNIDIQAMHDILNDLHRNGSIILTNRSFMFLQMTNSTEAHQFVEHFKNIELKRQSCITCMKKLNKNSADEDAINCLVIGTEDQNIYIVESEAFTILATMNCPATPSFLDVSGVYDVEFRILAACRNGYIYLFRRGNPQPRNSIYLNSIAVGLERFGKNIIVGCMDSSLHCYTTKGKRYWKHILPAQITAMCQIDYRPKGFQAVAVALANNEIHLYKDKFLVDVIHIEENVYAMKFGRLGREDATLVMVTKNGGLVLKILKRTAVFEESDVLHGPPKEQQVKIDVPKRTKLYVDQTLREKEQAENMYRIFQQDLIRLKLLTGKEFLQSIQAGLNPIAKTKTDAIRINAEVHGLGPRFKLTIKLQNTSAATLSPIIDLFLSFTYDENIYNLNPNYIEIPILINGIEYGFCSFVTCITDKAISDTIKVFVCRRDSTAPLISAVINMPIAEPNISI